MRVIHDEMCVYCAGAEYRRVQTYLIKNSCEGGKDRGGKINHYSDSCNIMPPLNPRGI